VEKKKRPDSGSVTTQHRHTEDETVMAKEFKRHHVTIRNVQVSNCNIAKGWKGKESNHAIKQNQERYCTTVKLTYFKELLKSSG